MLYQKLITRLNQIEIEISKITAKIKIYPSANIICTHNGKYTKWYQKQGDTLTYIPKSNRNLAEELAQKKYYSSSLEDLIHEKQAILAYQKHYNPEHQKSLQLLNANSSYRDLLTPYFNPQSEDLSNWAHEPFEQNPNYPEQLQHKCLSGNIVRSKSEALIDMALYMNRIPYRYECALFLEDDTSFYPDFTIRHPITGKLFYWEHFGMMDNLAYSKNAYAKLQFYTMHHIIPSINLIITCETQAHPLDSIKVNQIIQQYFLDC